MKKKGLREEKLDEFVETLYKQINGHITPDEELDNFSPDEISLLGVISVSASIRMDLQPLLLFLMEYYRHKTTTTLNLKIL